MFSSNCWQESGHFEKNVKHIDFNVVIIINNNEMLRIYMKTSSDHNIYTGLFSRSYTITQ